MPNPHYSARLKPDQAQGVDQFSEDKDIDQAEVIRRAVTEFLDERGYPYDDGKKVVADGGTVARPVLQHAAGTAASIALLVGLAGLFGIVTPQLTVRAGAGALIAACLLVTPLLSNAPELADRWGRRTLAPVTRRLGGGYA